MFVAIQVGVSFITPVLALKAAAPGNVHRCAQRLCDEVASRAMLESVPVLGLVLNLQERSLPPNRCPLTEIWGGSLFSQSLDPLCAGLDGRRRTSKWLVLSQLSSSLA